MLPLVLITAAVFVLDRLTKLFIEYILFPGDSLYLIKDFFHLTLIHNTGAAFGILKESNILFLLVFIIFLLVLIRLRKKILTLKLLTKAGVGLVLGGGLGNFTDRLLFGYVIDFLDIRVWPVFNVADMCICIGVGILCIRYCFK